jgi:CRP-like cAMP-binding protein
MNKLCKRLKYEYLVAGNYVFKEGDPSNDKYYVIIRGKVSVIVKKDRNVF